MGFFSWKTQDTNKSIPNIEQSTRDTFTVYLRDDKGNVWKEEAYSGYGDFGGKDYYELLAEMNGLGSDRDAGMNLAFDSERNADARWPALTENIDAEVTGKPRECRHQGFFYD